MFVGEFFFWRSEASYLTCVPPFAQISRDNSLAVWNLALHQEDERRTGLIKRNPPHILQIFIIYRDIKSRRKLRQVGRKKTKII